VTPFAIPFPAIDPVLIEIGPLAIRWYALAYIAGLVLGWQYLRLIVRREDWRLSPGDIDDLLVWAAIGVIVGGRLGFVLFYHPDHYFRNPHEIVMVWRGGMAFHGGLIGVIVAAWLFARRRGLPALEVGDAAAIAAPIGLLFGRIANFINAELWGRPTDVPWAVIFPTDPDLVPRHPSQLYQATLEGLLLFVVLAVMARAPRDPEMHGRLAGVFLAGYAVARGIGELFREPDAHLGLLFGFMTMGQLLSIPMLAAGIALIVRSWGGPGGRG
jgi:phosphatidylglycerol---prolipoprotein diacylglyceryl transferase